MGLDEIGEIDNRSRKDRVIECTGLGFTAGSLVEIGVRNRWGRGLRI